MPFARHTGYTFSAASIRQNAPACAGVYGLSNARGWILIGAAGDIQAALFERLREHDTPFSSQAATGFTFEACDAAAQNQRRNRLIAELDPVCNRPLV